MGRPTPDDVNLLNISGEEIPRTADNPVIPSEKLPRGVPITSNKAEMETARGIWTKKKPLDPTNPKAQKYIADQSHALASEVAARDWVEARYGKRAELKAAVRRKSGVPVFDYLFQTGRDEFVLLEAKSYYAELSHTADKISVGGVPVDGGHAITSVNVGDDVQQLSGKWVEQRIAELRKLGATDLADALDRSWQRGGLRTLVARNMPDAIPRGDIKSLAKTEQLFEVLDYTKSTNAQIRVPSIHRIPPGSEVGSSASGVPVKEGVPFANHTPEQRTILLVEGLFKQQLKEATKEVTRIARALSRLEGQQGTKTKRGKIQVAKDQVGVAQRNYDKATQTKRKAKPKPGKESPEQRWKKELETRKATLASLEEETKRLRLEAKQAADKVQVLEGQIAENRRLFHRLEVAKPQRPVRPPLEVPARPPTGAPSKALAERTLGTNAASHADDVTPSGSQTRGLEAPGVGSPPAPAGRSLATNPATGADDAVAAAAQAVSHSKGALRAARALKAVKFIGTVAVHLVVPLGVLDVAFDIALRIFAWDQKRRAAEREEWQRIASYFGGDNRWVPVPFVDRYKVGISDLIATRIDRMLLDERHPQNAPHWVERWNTNPKWLGFVYARVEVTLTRQELVQAEDDVEHRVRYFLKGNQPRVSFVENCLEQNNYKKELQTLTLAAGDSRNLITGGDATMNDEERSARLDAARIVGEQRSFMFCAVKSSQVSVRYTLPLPVLTPFDHVIYKCRLLIAELLQFASKFDEAFSAELDFELALPWAPSLHELVTFPHAMDTVKTRDVIKSLLTIIAKLSQHISRPDEWVADAVQRRRILVGDLLPPRAPTFLRQLRVNLAGVAQDGCEIYFLDPAEPELAHLTAEYLLKAGDSIADDLARLDADIQSQNPARAYEYQYRGTFDPP